MTMNATHFLAEPTTVGECDSCDKYGTRIKIKSISIGDDLCVNCFANMPTIEWKRNSHENINFQFMFVLWFILMLFIWIIKNY
jgi:hypothetical protein